MLHKPLTTCQRRGNHAGKVRQPVDKVERHVLLGGDDGATPPALLQHSLEGREGHRGRPLGLRQEATVEVQPGLGEQHCLLKLLRQAAHGRNEGWGVLKHVGQGHVMVAHLLALCVRAEGGMLGCHRGDEGLHLHDVVHRSEGQHGLEALLHCAGCPVRGPHQEASVGKELLELLPRSALVEQLALVPLAQLRPGLLRGGRPDGGRRSDSPLVVHAVAEAVLAVDLQAHKPVEGEEGADGSLVLVVPNLPRLRLALGNPLLLRLAGPRSEVEAELREGFATVIEETP
mmetsp:Transcript_15971/g.50141  ORF Transcript_15971/g.50141 Transcript_15971/m.50141 type:complete len:287 (+) Transcript_15971:827-1687(+)